MPIPKTYIIGEIGLNTLGDVDMTKRLIDVAVVAGCSAVKLQKRNPKKCVPEHQKSVMRDTPWGRMTYLDYKYKVEFSKEQYDEIDKYCKLRGIEWSASPWDLDSLRFLQNYDVPFIKIPSAMLTNHELIRAANDWCKNDADKKLIISTGMSTEDEIDEVMPWNGHTMDMAGKVINLPREQLVLLHCNSTYPASIDELNLSCIQTLKKRYGCAVGWSGHEFRLGTSVAAVYLGATYIERHITLDRSMWGSDQLSSVEPQGLMKLVSGIRELERAYGDGVIKVEDSEIPVRKKLRG